jgi:hypothetical protein
MSDRNIKSANTPVTYKTTLDVSAFEKVKLEQTFDDGSHKKVSFPIFTGDGSKTGNTEALIHCLDQYIRHTSKDLQWEDQERFGQSGGCSNWRSIRILDRRSSPTI